MRNWSENHFSVFWLYYIIWNSQKKLRIPHLLNCDCCAMCITNNSKYWAGVWHIVQIMCNWCWWQYQSPCSLSPITYNACLRKKYCIYTGQCVSTFLSVSSSLGDLRKYIWPVTLWTKKLGPLPLLLSHRGILIKNFYSLVFTPLCSVYLENKFI